MIVYTRVVSTRKYSVRILAFSHLGRDNGSRVNVDDCELALVDWDHKESADQNHERAVHELVLSTGAAGAGWFMVRLEEDEKYGSGTRKYLVN